MHIYGPSASCRRPAFLDPGTPLAGDRRAAAAAGLSQCMREAGREPRGSLARAPGGLWRAPGWRREDIEIAPGGMVGHWEVAGGVMSDLSISFPMFLCHRTLRAYMFQCFLTLGHSLHLCSEIAQGRVRSTIRGFSSCLGLRVGNLRGGVQVPLCPIPVTCHL